MSRVPGPMTTKPLSGQLASRPLRFSVRLCADAVPAETREILWNEVAVDEHLPRIAYVYMVLTQGLLHDTYLLGENASGTCPEYWTRGSFWTTALSLETA